MRTALASCKAAVGGGRSVEGAGAPQEDETGQRFGREERCRRARCVRLPKERKERTAEEEGKWRERKTEDGIKGENGVDWRRMLGNERIGTAPGRRRPVGSWRLERERRQNGQANPLPGSQWGSRGRPGNGECPWLLRSPSSYPARAGIIPSAQTPRWVQPDRAHQMAALCCILCHPTPSRPRRSATSQDREAWCAGSRLVLRGGSTSRKSRPAWMWICIEC